MRYLKPVSAWLCDLSNEVKPESTLIGFDIEPRHFPAPSYLPSNVKLLQQDVLATDIDHKLLNTFDIVHIRAFSSIVKNNDTTPVLSLAVKLLKPGGWLQWEEATGHTMQAEVPSEQALTSACTKILHVLREGGKASGVLTE